MNKRKTAYWLATSVVAFIFVVGGMMDVVLAPPVVETMRALGYPEYVAVILGSWKVLGGLAVLAPGLPRLKEWAYAGMVFDLSGAALSHLVVHDPVVKVVTPLVLIGVVMASWALRGGDRALNVGSLGRAERGAGLFPSAAQGVT